MSKLKIITLKPSQMTEIQKRQYISLHQRHLNLEDDFLINYLAPRDWVVLFYDKKNGHLVATVGVSIVNLKHDVLVYIGNTVVESEYKHSNCISNISSKYIIKSFLRHPFKKVYCCGFASSSGSFDYVLRHKPCWPNDDEKTPEQVTELMVSSVRALGVSNYYIEDGNVIASELCAQIKTSLHKIPERRSTKKTIFFDKINQHNEKGEQIFFMNLCGLTNVLDITVRGMRGHLIKCPKLYHKICRNKEKRPVYSSIMVLFALVKLKLWF